MSKGLRKAGVGGNSMTINRNKEEKKHILKGINSDVAKFLKEVDQVANAP